MEIKVVIANRSRINFRKKFAHWKNTLAPNTFTGKAYPLKVAFMIYLDSRSTICLYEIDM